MADWRDVESDAVLEENSNSDSSPSPSKSSPLSAAASGGMHSSLPPEWKANEEETDKSSQYDQAYQQFASPKNNNTGMGNEAASDTENQEGDEDLLRNLKHVKLSDDNNNDDFDNDQFTKHDQWFPPELRRKLHIAIIYDENDVAKAYNLKYFIENNVQLELDEKRFRPKVELLDHVNPGKHNDELDYVLEEADYLFVLVTNNFLKSNLKKYESIASVRAILKGDKQCSVVCVHTDQSSCKKLGAKLDNAKQLYYWKQEEFIERVGVYFGDISDRLLKRKLELTQLREKYVYEKLPFLWKQEQFTSRKEKNTGTENKTAPANDMGRDSGNSGNDGSRKPMDPQPHYR
ncbi:hypothetical protein BsWGS_01256 [Bradybaena similaris]